MAGKEPSLLPPESAYSMYAFGGNDEGQLGIGKTSKVSPKPTVVDTSLALFNPGLKGIHCGANHTLLHVGDNTVWVAGDNTKGQLATSLFNTSESSPNQLVQFKRGYEHVLLCAATSETSAYIIDGSTSLNPSRHPRLLTEGYGHFGELGRGAEHTTGLRDREVSAQLSSAFVEFMFPSPVIDLEGGNWHYIAVLQNGDIYGWGRNRHGQLGASVDSSGSQRHSFDVPTKIGGIPFPVKKAVCGKEFTYLAGDPNFGQHMLLGRDQYNLHTNIPSTLRGWKTIGATWHSIFVLYEDGRLHGWGKENQWRLIPSGLPKINQIAVGTEHILAVTSVDGMLLSWGWGFHGNCGVLEDLEGVKPGGVVSGFWNEVKGLQGKIIMAAAGYCTSFVLTARGESPGTGHK